MSLESIQPFINAAPATVIAFASSQAGLKLLDWLRNDIGVRQKPQQILNDSKAQAYADAEGQLIKQSYDPNATEDQRLTARSQLVRMETDKREQRNKDSVVMKALEALKEMKPGAKPEDVKTEEIDEDFRANFFDKCRLVSDKEMQMLWGKVLAGEVNEPGTFSRRTLNALSNLDKKDANSFVLLCQFSITSNNTAIQPLIYDIQDQFFKDAGLSFGTLKNLDSIGLISYESIGLFTIGLSKDGQMRINFFSNCLFIEWPEGWDGQFQIGSVMFTDLGSQVARLCSPQPYPGFEDYLIEKWKGFGYKVSIIRDGHLELEA